MYVFVSIRNFYVYNYNFVNDVPTVVKIIGVINIVDSYHFWTCYVSNTTDMLHILSWSLSYSLAEYTSVYLWLDLPLQRVWFDRDILPCDIFRLSLPPSLLKSVVKIRLVKQIFIFYIIGTAPFPYDAVSRFINRSHSNHTSQTYICTYTKRKKAWFLDSVLVKTPCRYCYLYIQLVKTDILMLETQATIRFIGIDNRKTISNSDKDYSFQNRMCDKKMLFNRKSRVKLSQKMILRMFHQKYSLRHSKRVCTYTISEIGDSLEESHSALRFKMTSICLKHLDN